MVGTWLSTGCAARERLWNSNGQRDFAGHVTLQGTSGKALGMNITLGGDW